MQTHAVRRRLPWAVAGFVVFTSLGAVADHQFWSQPWFYVGLGITVSATFVEPFFARPQDAIVNAAGGLGAFAGVERSPVDGLWLAYLGAMLALLAAGLLAAIGARPGSILNWATFRVASRLGRATVVGGSALFLVVVQQAASGHNDFEFLAGGSVVLIAALAVDWTAVTRRIRSPEETAIAVAAIGPRMLLVTLPASTRVEVGEPIEIESEGGSANGSVVARMPHTDGVRCQVALAADWSEVSPAFPTDVQLRKRAEESRAVGAVGEGSTDLRIVFEPFGPVDIGDPVTLEVENAALLYQVAHLELVGTSWSGAQAVVPRATAHIVGWPTEDGMIRGGSHLPRAHDLIHAAVGIERPLPNEYYEIGHIKGTRVPLGLRADAIHRGHTAILGMSGMGKTAVAHRICRTLAASNVVIALDTTGEYAGRLGFPPFADDLNTPSYTVYEPQGDPPRQAREFVERCMRAGVDEYRANAAITSRVLLLEEAHSFVPEWNFAQRNQQDDVSFTARMIMQARKFSISFVIVSQRTAVVSKSALSQCENYVILRTIDQTSLDYLESVVGNDMRRAVPSLARYEAVCVGPAFNAEEPVIVSLSPP